VLAGKIILKIKSLSYWRNIFSGAYTGETGMEFTGFYSYLRRHNYYWCLVEYERRMAFGNLNKVRVVR
jgi:hypothetical protein